MEERFDEGIIKGAKPSKLLNGTNLSYMKNYICKISGKLNGTGFFCKINYKGILTPVLMTNYHVIDEEFLEMRKQIILYVNNEQKILNINKNKKIYSSKRDKYDLIIIKLIEADEINIVTS